MENINTDMGRIFCRYNEEKDDFDKKRLIGTEIDVTSRKLFILADLNDQYEITDKEQIMSEEDYKEFKSDWIALSSEGVISLTNIVAATTPNHKQIKDVLLIYFPNNKMTEVPDVHNPYIVARQGITNLFAQEVGIDEAGMSVSLDTLPIGFALSDFMENLSVLSSRLTHVYKTDCLNNLVTILDNKETSDIFTDLFNHKIFSLKNTKVDFEYDEKDNCLGGFCKDLMSFMNHSDFITDLYNAMGIVLLDFVPIENQPLSEDDILYITALYGGIRIEKAVPLSFDYDIDMSKIKMKYILAKDTNRKLWIIPYTESKDEIDPQSMYNLTKDRTNQLQERLSKCVKTYEKSIENKD